MLLLLRLLLELLRRVLRLLLLLLRGLLLLLRPPCVRGARRTPNFTPITLTLK